MTGSLMLRVLITWLLFLPIPILNGFLRETWYIKIVGTTAAHQIGVAILSVIFLCYAYVSLRNHVAYLSTAQLLGIGILWLVLTLAFEFGVGIVEGRTWEYMFADYRIWEGRLWPIVLVVVLSSPFIVRWMTGART